MGKDTQGHTVSSGLPGPNSGDKMMMELPGVEQASWGSPSTVSHVNLMPAQGDKFCCYYFFSDDKSVV